MGGFFAILYAYFRHHRIAGRILLIVSAGLVLWSASGIRLTEDIYRVIPSDDRLMHYNRAMQHSGFSDELVMYVTATDSLNAVSPLELTAFADRLEDSLVSAFTPEYVREVRIRSNDSLYSELSGYFLDNLPLFLDSSDYETVEARISSQGVRQAMQQDLRSLLSPAGFFLRERILKDPLGLASLAEVKARDMLLDESYRLYNGFVFSADLRYLMVFITPSNPSTESKVNTRFLDGVDALVTELSREYGGRITADYFGSLAVSVSNARQIKRDIALTVSLAFLLLVFFIYRFLRKKFVSLAIFLPGVLGALAGISIIALVKGEVSAISLGFGAVLLGISIDFALHYLNHLKSTGDPAAVLRDISSPVMISSLSTGGAFFSLFLVRSEAINDLGLFAGLSIIASALMTLVIFPHLPFRYSRQMMNDRHRQDWLERLAGWRPDKNKWIVLAALALTIIFLFTSRRLDFERDMNRMSYVSKRLQAAEATLDRISNYTLRSVYVISTGSSLDSALESSARLHPEISMLVKAGTVKKVLSADRLILPVSRQQENIERWKRFWTGARIDSLVMRIDAEGEKLGFKPGAFNEFFSMLDEDFHTVPPEDLSGSLRTLTGPYLHSDRDMASVTTILKVRNEDKPMIYDKLGSKEHTLVFDKQFLTDKLVSILREDFSNLVYFSLVIVFLILLLSFGRIELAMLTFIPIFLGWIWTLGVMGLLGIKLTIFNIIITSFVFGMGDDYGIFLMEGMLQEYKYGREKLRSYKVSILLSAITTIIGTGVLIFARHPALKSIAISAIVGISAVWFITGLMKPLLFNWVLYHKGMKRPMPVTMRDLLFSVQSLLTYITGSILLTPLGMIARSLPGRTGKRMEVLFHSLIRAGAWLTVYQMFHIRKTILNKAGEDFRKPAVIICNHQSHIDLMLTLMLSTRLLVLTNERVQNHKIFGRLVRLADFFPSEKLSQNMEKLREKVRDGYSIIVFPEGTRSETFEVQRFHQGAFHLASQLSLDILPIVMHGSGHAMRKGELFLKASHITINILPRVAPGTGTMGSTPLEHSRNFRSYYARVYGEMKAEYETPRYFRDLLLKNYVYKGPVLEWYVRVKMNLERNFEPYIRHLPREGLITDIGCGYGYLSHMVALTGPARYLVGIDYDEEKISVAQNCPVMSESLKFISADVTEMDLPASQAYILGDVLHYLPEEKQERLLMHCADKLKEGGVMVIRDADRKQAVGHRFTRLTEFFSTRLLGFNRTITPSKALYFTTADRIREILSAKGLAVEVAERSEKTSNVLILARKGA